MALDLPARYPGRFDPASVDYPQGSFKNRTAPGALDGSYLEKDWANDKEGFFQSLIDAAALSPNGLVDKVGASQYYDALQAIIAGASTDYLNTARLDVASASTVNLTSLAPNTRHIRITGAVTINNFTVAADQCYFVTFASTPILTNGASLVTGSGANITAAALDTCVIYATAANTVRVMYYTPGIPQEVGYRQTWQNLTGSRSIGVTYTNTTGRPISVSVTTTQGSSGNASFTVGGVQVARISPITGGEEDTVYATVPNGATYAVTLLGGAQTLDNWAELR